MNFKSRILAASLAASFSFGLAACGSSAEEEGSLEGEPIEAIAAPDGTSWVDTVSRTEKGGWVMGNPDAPIKLVEYGSFFCPACAVFSAQATEPLQQDYIASGRVSFEIRSIMGSGGPLDLLLTRVIECAPEGAGVTLADQAWANQEQFFAARQQNVAQIEAEFQLPMNQRFVAISKTIGAEAFFAARGISAAESAQCLSDETALENLAEVSANAANEDGVDSTPFFTLNGQSIGNQGWSSLEPMLQRAGAR